MAPKTTYTVVAADDEDELREAILENAAQTRDYFAAKGRAQC